LNRKEVDWPQKLFIKHGNLFLRLLQNRAESTNLEVDGLVRIFEEFKVPKNSRILDVSCGIGRHSIPLAERGYNVLGLDISPLFIARANAAAKARKVNSRAKFRVADVREIVNVLQREELFNMVLSLCSSHGYYGKEEDDRMFAALRNRTARNGLFVDDTVNRDYLIPTRKQLRSTSLETWNSMNVGGSTQRLRGIRATGRSTRRGERTSS
jgi:2-polyprenyl-3-methyl-5-hydroxy-6-metoxy-1,4-benzoquinol methylase